MSRLRTVRTASFRQAAPCAPLFPCLARASEPRRRRQGARQGVSMSAVSVPSRRRPKRASLTAISAHLPHWSETEGEPRPRFPRPPPDMIEILRDLTSWAADIAIRLTGDCPEDREAID